MAGIVSSFARLLGEAIATIYRGAPGFEAHLWPDAALTMTGEAGAWFNLAAVGDSPLAGARLHEFARRLGERGIPGLVFVAEEAADRLSPVARALGWQEAGCVPFMTYRPERSPTSAPGCSFAIDLVRNEADLREANRLTAAAFEFGLADTDRVWPPAVLEALGLELFLARREGRPVSTVATTAHGGTVIGIWLMATPPADQRQDAGRALLDHVIADHVGRGAEEFFLFATEQGRQLYDRVGFRPAAEMTMWLVGDSGPAALH